MQNVSDMLSFIDDHGFEDANSNTKLDALNTAIADFNAREPWPFLEAQPVTLTFNGTSSVPTNLPSDFGAVLTLVDPNTGRLIMPERIDNLEKEAAQLTTQTGSDPIFYYFIGGQLNFAAIPGASFTARLRYLRVQPEVTGSSTSADIFLPTRHWMAYIEGALSILYDQDDDPEMAVRMQTRLEARVERIRNELWGQQYDRSDSVRMTDPDFLIDFPI